MTFSHSDHNKNTSLLEKIMLLVFLNTGILTTIAETSIEVRNPSSFSRDSEMIEIPVSEIPEIKDGKIFRIVGGDAKEYPYQITHDGLLIFEVTAGAGEKAVYTIVEGMPSDFTPVCYGRQFPERKDDLAWENDKSAYRAYGPALQRSGEKAYGYDIWSKSVPYPILEQRFYDDIVRKISFHDDHGNGMDGYAVGATLGGGTAALINKAGGIVYPYCYESYEILDRGPLRFSVRLTYPPVEIDGRDVKETRVISLDKGNWLNKTVLSYDGLGRDAEIFPEIFQGIVVHSSNADGFILSSENKFVSYEDFTDAPEKGNGVVYVGIVSPDSERFIFVPRSSPKKPTEQIYDSIESVPGDGIGGHVGAVAELKSEDDEFVYYWGSGWSKGGVTDYAEWQRILSQFSGSLREPLKVSVVINN